MEAYSTTAAIPYYDSKREPPQQNEFEKTNYIANNYIWPTVPIGFLVFGTVANILSIIVFTRREMRKFSSFCYFAVLNIVNLCFLYVTLSRVISEFNFKSDLRASSLLACKLHVFLTYFLSHLSSLILSSISIDRVISVVFLHLAKELCTPRMSFIVTTFLVIFTFTLSSHFLFLESGHIDYVNVTRTTGDETAETSHDVVLQERVVCETRPGTMYANFIKNIWTIIDICIYAFIPFFIMLTCSVIIILRVAQQSKKFQKPKSAATSEANLKDSQCMVPLTPGGSSQESHKYHHHHHHHHNHHKSDNNNPNDTPKTARTELTIDMVTGEKSSMMQQEASTSKETSTITTLKQRKQSLPSAIVSKVQDVKFNKRTRNLALMLIPVNILFLIFLAPVVMTMYLYNNLGSDNLALAIVEILSYCNFTINFVIYFMTSSKFREEFFKFLDETCKKRPQNRYQASIAPTGTGSEICCFCMRKRPK